MLQKQTALTLPSTRGMFQRGPSDIDVESHHSRNQRSGLRCQRDGVRCFECSAIAGAKHNEYTEQYISSRMSHCNRVNSVNL